jgi:hypothetical protein
MHGAKAQCICRQFDIGMMCCCNNRAAHSCAKRACLRILTHRGVPRWHAQDATQLHVAALLVPYCKCMRALKTGKAKCQRGE